MSKKGERIFIVSYDISSPKRWRRVFNTLEGYGEWLQLSVFQCRMSERRKEELISELDKIINFREDHVLFIDIGRVETVQSKVFSLGKMSFKPIEKKAFVF